MYLFNLSITTGIFPDILKTSKVIVIYKKYNRCDNSNYRVIFTSQFSKNVEKLIKIRILNLLNNLFFLKRVHLVSKNLHQLVMHFLILLVIYKQIMINIAQNVECSLY